MTIRKAKLRSARNYDMHAASIETGLGDEGVPSKTVQSEKDSADINVIVKRFGVTRQLPQGVRTPTFGDFEGVNDFQSAMNAIRSAEESFMAMPSGVRSRFENDPQKFVEFCSNEENLDELRKMGLAMPAKEPIIPPVVAPVVPPVTTEVKKDGEAK